MSYAEYIIQWRELIKNNDWRFFWGTKYLLWSISFFWVFLNIFYCISSDFSDLPDMTDEYIDLSVYALTGWLLYILHLTYIQK